MKTDKPICDITTKVEEIKDGEVELDTTNPFTPQSGIELEDLTIQEFCKHYFNIKSEYYLDDLYWAEYFGFTDLVQMSDWVSSGTYGGVGIDEKRNYRYYKTMEECQPISEKLIDHQTKNMMFEDDVQAKKFAISELNSTMARKNSQIQINNIQNTANIDNKLLVMSDKEMESISTEELLKLSFGGK